eukprot:6257337-Amphidinium_carterae.1
MISKLNVRSMRELLVQAVGLLYVFGACASCCEVSLITNDVVYVFCVILKAQVDAFHCGKRAAYVAA